MKLLTVLLIGMSVAGAREVAMGSPLAAGAAQKPSAPQAAPPAPQAPARPAPPPPTPTRTPAVQAAPAIPQACAPIAVDEAKSVLGPDAIASAVPSKSLFTTCGYTSPAGDALTITIADYGLPLVAQQFFDKTRELLKTAVVDGTVGAPAFSYVTPATGALTAAAGGPAPGAGPSAGTVPRPTTAVAPVAGAPASASTAGTPAALTLVALKDQRTVKLEASGPLAGRPEQLPKLRAIMTRVLAMLPAPPPPPAPETPR